MKKWCETLTLPTLLTLVRLVISPIVIPFLLVYLLPFNVFLINLFLAIIFLLFALTDFFDGYYARKWGQVTHLGSLLDPIADKFLLCAALIALVAAEKIYFYWVIILIGREFFVMGLRYIASEKNIDIPVSWLAKIKTALEIGYIAFVIAYVPQPGVSIFSYFNIMYYGLLFGTLSLSLYTAYCYYMHFLTYFINQEIKNPSVYDDK
ncbi:CDP-diacylglycerol--glycerol-3-phosphate 3-phosphatidyltransferase [Candidatus Dependentiae bacterium]|nr:MAG: CDP-diacylglycerol--glycerol-3-phosphate 3-phosphatidyltransferase [Candidatus Dependentiae bacterium]